MHKILFTGTTTSGKSTLIQALVASGIPGLWLVEEEARKFLDANPSAERDPRLQDWLFDKQVAAERSAEAAGASVLICDRGVPDNIAHALFFGQNVKPEWIDWSQTYDHIFVFNSADIEYRPTELQMRIDPDRDWSAFRNQLDHFIYLSLIELGLPFQILEGSISRRLETVEAALSTFKERT